mgnify:CR=1 FL=1
MFDLVLVPAYGRTYKTEAAVLKDWNSGLDFKIARGPYVSIRDIKILREEYLEVLIFWSTGELLGV